MTRCGIIASAALVFGATHAPSVDTKRSKWRAARSVPSWTSGATSAAASARAIVGCTPSSLSVPASSRSAASSGRVHVSAPTSPASSSGSSAFGKKPRSISSPTSCCESPLRSTWLSSSASVSSLVQPSPHALAGASRCCWFGRVWLHMGLKRSSTSLESAAPAGDCQCLTKRTLSCAWISSSSRFQKPSASSKSAMASGATLGPSFGLPKVLRCSTSSVSWAWPIRKPAARSFSKDAARPKPRSWMTTTKARSASP